MKGCSVCGRPVVARGWCSGHYQRWRRHGDPLAGRPPALGWPANLLTRITMRPGSECWEFTGPRNGLGYGRLSRDGKDDYAHRGSYELLVGPIPDGLTLDHLCRNPPCVNPAHLEPVTMAENSRRGTSPPAVNFRKTHCVNGHEFTEENTYRRPDNGRRVCRRCVFERKVRTREQAKKRRKEAS